MQRTYLHAMPVRVWHWVNAASFFVLIVTGAQIRYREAFDLMSFRSAVDLHNLFGFVLLGNFLVWAIYYLATGRLKVYIPDPNLKNFVIGTLKQARYYGYGIFVGEPNPHHASPDHKFNPMQQVAYFNIMLLFLPLQIVSGILMWDIKRFAMIIGMAGGIKVIDAVHVFLTLFFTAFLFVHIYLATLGHPWTAHLKAMFTGYEDEPGDAPTH
ncbi:MAG: cytochrome b/b6 domain-containing protein [Nitrospiraceae bacterium]|nr:cytochrome b/b6 domain-containing protein [Nitrospiraceae bacterium]